MKTLLRIDSSPRKGASVSRQLADTLQERLQQENSKQLIHRDLYYDDLVRLGNEDQINGYFTPVDQQTQVQQEAVSNSNLLAQEFAQADEYLFAVPMYNFGVSAGLKTYIDLISRAGITFTYNDGSPSGLLRNKKAYIIVATGGTPLDSDYDFVSPYLRTFLNFLGVTDIQFITLAATQSNLEQALQEAKENIQSLTTA